MVGTYCLFIYWWVLSALLILKILFFYFFVVFVFVSTWNIICVTTKLDHVSNQSNRRGPMNFMAKTIYFIEKKRRQAGNKKLFSLKTNCQILNEWSISNWRCWALVPKIVTRSKRSKTKRKEAGMTHFYLIEKHPSFYSSSETPLSPTVCHVRILEA